MKDGSSKKHCLLVGGTLGLGRALTKYFSHLGNQVSVIGKNPPVESDGGVANVKHWTLDLTHQTALSKSLSEIIDTNGPLTNLIFLQRYRGKENDWEGEIATSISATRFIIEELAAKFDASQSGSIVFVSALAGDYVIDTQPVSYHLGKAAMNQLMRYYAVKLGPKGIRVNAVSPFTFVKEESREFYSKNSSLQELYKKMVPLGRLGTSEDIVKVIGFLCSSDAAFITGQNLYVDGGLSLRWAEAVGRQIAGV